LISCMPWLFLDIFFVFSLFCLHFNLVFSEQ
jgi:hypothetical protein